MKNIKTLSDESGSSLKNKVMVTKSKRDTKASKCKYNEEKYSNTLRNSN